MAVAYDLPSPIRHRDDVSGMIIGVFLPAIIYPDPDQLSLRVQIKIVFVFIHNSDHLTAAVIVVILQHPVFLPASGTRNTGKSALSLIVQMELFPVCQPLDRLASPLIIPVPFLQLTVRVPALSQAT